MMRTRDKLDSYRVLAKALGLLKDKPWRALLVGDGPARAEVEAMMAPFNGGERVRFAGALPHAELPAVYAGADLYLWPAINEAYGMAFLEAQAAGLPVVAGRTGGVPAVVADGVTGVLTPIGDAAAFAAAVGATARRPRRARTAGGGARSASTPATTSARPPMRWPPRLADAAMSVPFAILRHATTDWNVERPPAGPDRHPAQRRRRGRGPHLAPAGAGRRLAAASAARCSAPGAPPSCCSRRRRSSSIRRCAR